MVESELNYETICRTHGVRPVTSLEVMLPGLTWPVRLCAAVICTVQSIGYTMIGNQQTNPCHATPDQMSIVVAYESVLPDNWSNQSVLDIKKWNVICRSAWFELATLVWQPTSCNLRLLFDIPCWAHSSAGRLAALALPIQVGGQAAGPADGRRPNRRPPGMAVRGSPRRRVDPDLFSWSQTMSCFYRSFHSFFWIQTWGPICFILSLSLSLVVPYLIIRTWNCIHFVLQKFRVLRLGCFEAGFRFVRSFRIEDLALIQ